MKIISLALTVLCAPCFAKTAQKATETNKSQSNKSEVSTENTCSHKLMTIVVAGLVKNPGTVKVKKGSTVLDAVNAAGGIRNIGSWQRSFIIYPNKTKSGKLTRTTCVRTKEGVEQFKKLPIYERTIIRIE